MSVSLMKPSLSSSCSGAPSCQHWQRQRRQQQPCTSLSSVHSSPSLGSLFPAATPRSWSCSATSLQRCDPKVPSRPKKNPTDPIGGAFCPVAGGMAGWPSLSTVSSLAIVYLVIHFPCQLFQCPPDGLSVLQSRPRHPQFASPGAVAPKRFGHQDAQGGQCQQQLPRQLPRLR